MKYYALFLSLILSGLCIPSAGAATDFTPGNPFAYAGAKTAAANTTTWQYARFTATETSNATSISIHLNDVLPANVTTATVGLQLDDGTGKPNGTFVAMGTITTATGWNTVTLPGYELLEGQTYHVVVKPTEGSVPWRLLDGVTTGATPFGHSGTLFARGTINAAGPAAAANTGAVTYHVGTTGSVAYGQPYHTATNINVAVAPTAAVPAQRFIYHAQETGDFLDTVTLRLNTSAAGPANDLTIAFLSDDNILLGSATFAAKDLTLNTTVEYTIQFAPGIELLDGEAYRLAVYSTGSLGNSVRWYAMTMSNSAYADAGFQGVEGYTFYYKNNTLSEIQSTDLLNDFFFIYTTSAIPEPATFAFAGISLLIPLAFRRFSNRNQLS